MKIAIIGGGFTGLTAAYVLSKQGHTVTVFEKEKELGGLAVGLKNKNWEWTLEKGYHHLFTNDDEIIGLLGQLGLTDKIIVKRPVTANFTSSGHLVQFDRPGDLFSYSEFSILDKIRTAILLTFLKLNPFWKPLEGLTAKQLLTGIGGNRPWKLLWEPLMNGKFGDLDNTVAASWMWARINKRTPSLVYISGGFQTLVTTLETEIIKNHGTIKIGTTIERIGVNKSDGYKLNNTRGFSILNNIFDTVLLTIPTAIISKIVPELSPDLSKTQSIPHLHAQTLILETKEPILRDAYWVSILDRTFPFLAAVAHTNFMDKKHYGGHHLTYFGNYLPFGHKYLTMTKEQLLSVFKPYIKRLSQNSKLEIINSYLFIGPFAQPVHQRYYSRVAPTLTTPIAGLYIANLDSVYPWDRGTNYAVELGRKAAKVLVE